MPRILNYQDIIDILYGAAFLGGGGGGPLDIALDMLKGYEDRTVSLYECTEMSNTDRAAVVAAMGNPMKAAGKDFNSILYNTFKNIKESFNQVNCVIAGECGGFNTFAPIYLALNNSNIKLIDADASGRAVPGLDTSMASVCGVSITPFNVTSEQNDCVTIRTNPDSKFNSAQKCEMIARHVSGVEFFGDVGGIAGWIMDYGQLKESTITGGISKCQNVGKAIREYKCETAEVQKDGVFSYLNKRAIIHCISIEERATLNNMEENELEGFADGSFHLNLSNKVHRIKIRYVNEFLVCGKYWVSNKWKGEEIIATAPTIITLFDEENFVPVTDSYLKKNTQELKTTRLSLGFVSVKDTWGKLSEYEVNKAWKKYLSEVGYNENCIIY